MNTIVLLTCTLRVSLSLLIGIFRGFNGLVLAVLRGRNYLLLSALALQRLFQILPVFNTCLSLPQLAEACEECPRVLLLETYRASFSLYFIVAFSLLQNLIEQSHDN